MSILESAPATRAAVVEPPTTKARSILSRARATFLIWYDAFVEAQEMGTQAQKQWPRLGE
jgi:hypothetical protein